MERGGILRTRIDMWQKARPPNFTENPYIISEYELAKKKDIGYYWYIQNNKYFIVIENYNQDEQIIELWERYWQCRNAEDWVGFWRN